MALGEDFPKLDKFTHLLLAKNIDERKSFDVFGLSLSHSLYVLNGIILGRNGQPILARNLLVGAKSHETWSTFYNAELRDRITR